MEFRHLSTSDVSLLRQRQLSPNDINVFERLLGAAEQSQLPAQQFISTLNGAELDVVQRANALADPIAVNNLTAEGATNLFASPNGEGLVDFNNDGIVEVGVANTIHFPPVNAPQYIHAAWAKATEGLDNFDKATLELTMHHMVYGFQLDGLPTKTPLQPSQQWSINGVSGLLGDLYSNLDFRVGMDGWTERNRTLQMVYQTFQVELETYFEQPIQPSRHNHSKGQGTSKIPQQQTSSPSSEHNERLAELNQMLLDARIGLDREKIEELEKEMEAVRRDTSLSPHEKTQKLQALQAEIERVIEEARRRAVEEEKRKSTLDAAERISENSRAQQVKRTIFEFL